MIFTDSGSESGSHKSIREKRPSGPSGDGKPTRVRTVLNEKQLHTLRYIILFPGYFHNFSGQRLLFFSNFIRFS